MDIEKLRKYYGRCDPYESLAPDDPMNVDIDSSRSGDGPIRGKRWSSKLARQIELSRDKPVCTYFSGLPGSRKTTELRRLAAHLESPEGGRWLPVLANAEDLLRGRRDGGPSVMGHIDSGRTGSVALSLACSR